MKNDNRGLSLAELVVSLAIFAIVLTSVFSFMLAGSKAYTNISDRLSLDLDAELLMNQLTEYLIDCNGTVYYHDHNLYVVNQEEDGSYTAQVFAFRPDDKAIYFGSGTAKKIASGSSPRFSTTATATDLLAENVAALEVQPVSRDGARLSSVRIFFKLAKGTDIYTAEKALALRNRPVSGAVSGG